MIEVIDGGDRDGLAQIQAFRLQVFTASRRDQGHAAAWQSDDYDPMCEHLVLRDEQRRIIAAVRVATQGRWPLEDRYPGELDKSRGVEFGRLGVAVHLHGDRRSSFELMAFAARRCLAVGRPLMYGLTIEPFWSALRREGVPLQVLSGPIDAYGETENVILFDAGELTAFYDRVTARLVATANPVG